MRNIARHNHSGADDLIAVEIEHLRAVTEILTAKLLYGPNDCRHDPAIDERYWDEVRPRYLAHADPESCNQHVIGWQFLALSTRGRELYEAIESELRDSIRNRNADA